MVRTWGAQRSVPAISKVAVKGDGQLSADSESKIALCAFFWQQVRGITTITKRCSKHCTPDSVHAKRQLRADRR
jgi:hypothetical protein